MHTSSYQIGAKQLAFAIHPLEATPVTTSSISAWSGQPTSTSLSKVMI